MTTATFKIHGMDCAEEIAILKRELAPVPGVADLSFNLLDGTMTVALDGEALGPHDIVRRVARTGMRAQPADEAEASAVQGTLWDQHRGVILTGLSGAATAGGFAAHAVLAGWRAAAGFEEASVPTAAVVLYLVATLAGVWQVLPKAWNALRRVRPDMNLLMVVAVSGAIAIGEYAEAATVAFLFSLSLALESWSVGRARRAVGALMALAPPQALVIDTAGNETLVPVEQVEVGSRFVVKPGEKVPLDGRVDRGETHVNQAPLTGESLPVAKTVGDEVFAGSINEDGAIEAVSVKPASQSLVSQIVKMVREAQSRRSPSEQWVEVFARYYTPAVFALALAVALVPPLIFGAWAEWFYRALVLLVIACPCALVISTPVSIVAALAAAAREGVLVKGGVYVELPARLRAVAMDKTGTLTHGKPAVTRVIAQEGVTEEELLRIAAAVELRSEHPLARAIVEHAKSRGIEPAPVEQYKAVKGKGAIARLDGRELWVGSHRYLEERKLETPQLHDSIELLTVSGSSIVVLGDERRVLGFIALSDQVRPESKAAVAALKAAGVEHVVMLTGDNRGTAEAIADAVGIDEFRAELLPQDKVTAVEELVARYGQVAMIGDGVNDAPAMARSSMGVAMGAIGTDAALETADVALMSDDLSKLPWLIVHARRTLRVIRQNIVASLAVKALFVVLTFLGFASLWAAIAADTGMSLLVVFNALRLLRPRRADAVSESAHA